VGHFEFETDTTWTWVSFRNNSGAYYDCGIDGSAVEFIERAKVHLGQPEIIAAPEHDTYLTSSWDPEGNLTFGVFLPL